MNDAPEFERVNILTGEVATRVRAARVEDAIRACDVASAAFPAWAALGPNARRLLLLKAADALAARADEFVATMMAEIGATAGWAGFNVHLGVGLLREAASQTTYIRGETIPSDRPGCFAMSVRKPAGVVLGMAPWNGPLILGVRAIATPLACGNTVILKGSEVSPGTHALIGEVFRDAGFPEGVVNVVLNAPTDAADIVGAMIAHPAVRRVNFTGSTHTGRIIAKTCAEHLKPIVLELGGKAPLLVFEDADLDEAVAAAAFGAFMNSGQICMSTERLIVHEAVAQDFVALLAKKAESLVASDPRNGNAPLGPVIDARAAAAVTSLIDDALSKGAKLFGQTGPNATIMSARFLTGVTPEMRIYHEESFGPITTILTFADEAEALRIANDTEFGLTSSVFTKDISRGLRVADKLDAGMCHINGPTIHDEAHMPFGGVKASGYGRFGGTAGIAEFTELRWITVDTQHLHYPI
ncbi:aldehyde dehydrogenase [Sphingobium sp.]|uniref:aldehyde dehydrogenase n=1 Tax=Sphingobium sp. TaxID=1912891 RepID=UPI0028BF08F9|nr:aldehyde dehydrogenase [Sphingobium sp.]